MAKQCQCTINEAIRLTFLDLNKVASLVVPLEPIVALSQGWARGDGAQCERYLRDPGRACARLPLDERLVWVQREQCRVNRAEYRRALSLRSGEEALYADYDDSLFHFVPISFLVMT